MNDSFYTKDSCDRCGSKNMNTRTMSWFTEETICMDCSAKERPIKEALYDKGIEKAMEGCGFIPNPEDY